MFGGHMVQRERILITGSAGLIGRATATRLASNSAEIIRYDLRHRQKSGRHDLHDVADLEHAVKGATGIVHLGAVSRVGEGENDPARCWSTNVEATRHLLQLAAGSRERPWVVFASSREVYGQQKQFPVSEDAPLRPANVYARSKAAAESLIGMAREEGLRACVVRLSNVYGDIDDYADRVVPAFAAAAARGGFLRVEGPENALDLVHLDDTVDGLCRIAGMFSAGEKQVPLLHLVSGARTTLAELAGIAVSEGAPGTKAVQTSPRSFAVREFYGDPARARAVLGWRATIPIRTGFANLVSAYARALRKRTAGPKTVITEPENLCLRC
jgi:nucleoside-diphosphate-sugar epimerase